MNESQHHTLKEANAMRVILAVLLLATPSSAALLSQIDLYHEVAQPPEMTEIGFSILAGTGGSLLVNSDADVSYLVPTQSVNTMYAMAHNPSAYQAHGPVLAIANIGDWVLDPWHKFWQDSVNVIAEPSYSAGGASIHGSPAVLTTPWQSITLRRTAWQPVGNLYGSTLTISIYDQAVPEPTLLSLASTLGTILSWRMRRRQEYSV
jgi:hypothetical protein